MYKTHFFIFSNVLNIKIKRLNFWNSQTSITDCRCRYTLSIDWQNINGIVFSYRNIKSYGWNMGAILFLYGKKRINKGKTTIAIERTGETKEKLCETIKMFCKLFIQ